MRHPTLVLLAGGRGTRFWPKSTQSKPKQLLDFGTGQTLIQETLKRFSGLIPPEKRWVLTTESLKDAIERECGSTLGRVLAEPMAKNTAPCIYWAARELAEEDPQALMWVVPSDQWIGDLASFQKTIEEASQWAAATGDLVTLGVTPTRPETGYGYLHVGKTHPGVMNVKAFIEKPSFEKATQYLESGEMLWNAGMFIWRVESILEAYTRFLPEFDRIWKESQANPQTAFEVFPSLSIDYGILEKSPKVMTFALNCGWDDLGSWASMHRLAKNEAENAVLAGEVVALESTHNLIDAPGELVALLGVKDLVIVRCAQTLLVAHQSKIQDIRALVSEVEKSHPDQV